MHAQVRSPIQIGIQPVLILPVLLILLAASEKALNDEAAGVPILAHTVCAAMVVFSSVCPSLVGQHLDWYHANHVFCPVYMALVAFRSSRGFACQKAMGGPWVGPLLLQLQTNIFSDAKKK